jgi:hypothetical protein
MKYFAMVGKESKVVENVMLWDGETEYYQDEKFDLVEITEENVGIGWSYENGIFVEPPPKPMPIVDVTDVVGDAPNVIA